MLSILTSPKFCRLVKRQASLFGKDFKTTTILQIIAIYRFNQNIIFLKHKDWLIEICLLLSYYCQCTVAYLFPKKAPVLTCLKYKFFENTMLLREATPTSMAAFQFKYDI